MSFGVTLAGVRTTSDVVAVPNHSPSTDRPGELIFQLWPVLCRPKGEVKDKTLLRSALCLGHADARKNFELLDVNAIALSVVGIMKISLPSRQT
jgi:hypothetical protein